LQPEPAAATIPSPDEQTRQVAESPEAAAPGDIAPRQQPPIPPEDARYAGLGQPEPAAAGAGERRAAGTSNRQNVETYGENAVPSGTGVDTGELLDSARAAIRSGDLNPYSVLERLAITG